MDWKTKYRIKAFVSAASMFATFALLASLSIKVGIFFIPLSVLPGMLVTTFFLWPEVMEPQPSSPGRLRLFRTLTIVMYAAIWGACMVVQLMPPVP